MKARRITFLAMLLALAIALGIAESYIPGFWMPGIKLGLTNIIILLVLYTLSPWEALFITLARVLLVSLIRGTFMQMGFLMSLSGALLSLLIMWLSKAFLKKLTIVGVSVLGAVFHNIGQVLVGVWYLENPAVLYYLPFMTIISIATGILFALAVEGILKTGVVKHLLKEDATH